MLIFEEAPVFLVINSFCKTKKKRKIFKKKSVANATVDATKRIEKKQEKNKKMKTKT